MKVIIIDERTDFLNYVKNRLSVCDDLDVEVIGYLADMSTIDDYLDKADLALIADNIASDSDFKYPSMDVYGYETSDEYSEALYQADMENVGRIVKPRDMVDFIWNQMPIVNFIIALLLVVAIHGLAFFILFIVLYYCFKVI